jgi:hypothetical protein
LCRELAHYTKQHTINHRGLGRWCLTLFLSDPNHKFRLVLAYNVGRKKPKGASTIYQQKLRYIQNNGWDLLPARLFVVDFIAQHQTWQQQGNRLLVFIDMNKHILRGHLAKYMLNMGLMEVAHHEWGNEEPNTYFKGIKLIDGVWHSHQLIITSTVQLLFHEGVGDHRSVLVDITTDSAIGKQGFKVVHPNACRLSSRNKRARLKYISHLEQQMLNHQMVECLQLCKDQATSYPALSKVQVKMQRIDSQVVEMQ